MRHIVGIDEVGRGALAGPVVVAAVLATGNWLLTTGRPKGKMRDSKKLTPKKREEWSRFLRTRPRLSYAIARVYPRQIEKRNIAKAANLAAKRAFERLLAQCRVSSGKCQVFLDGGLYLGNKKEQMANRRWNAKTVVRGDEKIKAIAAASIIAKVSRDRGMVRLAKKYPQYGFEIHKGYGTKKHMAAIKKHGPSGAHRKSFDPIKKIW